MLYIKKLAERHAYLFSFLTAFIAISLLYYSAFWLFRPDNPLKYGIKHILAYLIPVAFVLGILLSVCLIHQIGFQRKGLGKGILFGWLFLFGGVFLFLSSFISLDKNQIMLPDI